MRIGLISLMIVGAIGTAAHAKPLTKFDYHVLAGDVPTTGTRIAARVTDPAMCDPKIVGSDNVGSDCDPSSTPTVAGWKDELARLREPDTIVVSAAAIELIIDYPIDRPVAFAIKAESPKGFTRAQLLERIGEVYDYIYAQEAKTSATPAGRAGNTFNRSKTHGAFGVCCHDEHDLFVEGITFAEDAKHHTQVWLSIGS